MTDAAPSIPAFDELPYLDEYLQEVLRPRVERVLQSAQRSITESLWRQIIKILAAEQPTPGENTPAVLRHLLEQRLGLKLQATLSHSFESARPARAEPRLPLEVVITARENGEAARDAAVARP